MLVSSVLVATAAKAASTVWLGTAPGAGMDWFAAMPVPMERKHEVGRAGPKTARTSVQSLSVAKFHVSIARSNAHLLASGWSVHVAVFRGSYHPRGLFAPMPPSTRV